MRSLICVLALVSITSCTQLGPPPSQSEAKPDSESVPEANDNDRCYPYLPEPSGRCRTSCSTREHCAGSRGPADFEEKGWPLDCIRDECVPLPPEAVTPG